jgi:hypothetical protein
MGEGRGFGERRAEDGRGIGSEVSSKTCDVGMSHTLVIWEA